MLVGIVLLVTPMALNLPVPDWWDRVMALIIISGGFAELYTVWSYSRRVR
jgi:hypothetical protein